jgi:hypothetical protein
MAFDLNTASPEMKKSPEVLQTPEVQEVAVEVAPTESAPAVQYAAQEVAEQPQIEASTPPAPVATNVETPQDPLYKKIEGVLADEAIGTLYGNLPKAKKDAFRIQGEKLAHEITESIRRRKFKPYKALMGTRKWLGMVDAKFPYLLQKAKNELDELQEVDEAVGKGEEIVL